MKTKRTLLIIGIVMGAVIMASAFIGLFGTVLDMLKAFQVLGSSALDDPEVLAEAIGEVLISAFTGIIGAIPGAILFIGCIVGLVRLNNRQAKKSTME